MKRYIDLRSDTVTIPTQEMRKAMADAEVGDDVYGDDPTVIKLQNLAAEMLGKEAALFVPSGTMGNQLAIMTFTKKGDEIIVWHRSHVVMHEVGAAALLSNVSYALVKNNEGYMTDADVLQNIRTEDVHYPDTGLVCIESPLGDGTVMPLSMMEKVYNTARKHNLPVHMDGARVFNAAVYLNTTAKEIAQYCDSVMFCISKGLSSPIGSLLCGDKLFIQKAKKYRKLLGGGMRQAGVLAAAGLISLEKMTKRLHTDHDNAMYLAKKLAELPDVSIDMKSVQINMVYCEITKQNFDHKKFVSYMLEKGIKINPTRRGKYRLVTHNDVSREDIDFVIENTVNFITN